MCNNGKRAPSVSTSVHAWLNKDRKCLYTAFSFYFHVASILLYSRQDSTIPSLYSHPAYVWTNIAMTTNRSSPVWCSVFNGVEGKLYKRKEVTDCLKVINENSRNYRKTIVNTRISLSHLKLLQWTVIYRCKVPQIRYLIICEKR